MIGSTQWLVRPGDVIHVEEIMAKRWEKSGLAKIVGKPEKPKAEKPAELKPETKTVEETELTVAELRDIARDNGLPMWGTKAEITERLKEAGLMPDPEENLLEPELS